MDQQIPSVKKIKELIEEVFKEKIEELKPKQDIVIVSTEEEIIKYSKLGYSCNPIGNNKWLMKI